MKKLIDLLNEYEKSWLNEFEEYEEWWYCKWNWKILTGNYENNNELTPYELCSKKFWFIKWLVDNNKIDLDKVENKFYNEICITDYWDKNRACSKSNLVISVLSISDNPIQDLISLLK